MCRLGRVKADWARLVRAVVHGEYFLKSFDGERQGAGLFRASDAKGAEVDVYVMPADAAEAEAFSRHWSAAASFSHPGLLRTLAFGPVPIDRAAFLCAVSEKPEERLSEVVSTRSLTPDEAREVLESTLPALEYLHEQKFLHGDYGVHSIVASDGRAKLTTATIRPFSRSSPEDRAALAKEIKAVHECTRDMLSGPGAASITIPPEFAVMLRTISTADERWSPTAADLLHALKGVDVAPEEELPAPEVPAAVVAASARKRSTPSEAVLIAAAALVAIIAATIYFAWPDRPADTAEAPPSRPVFRADASTVKPAPTKAATPPTPAATQQRARRAGEWAVVAAIYKERGAAARRAEQLAAKSAELKPEVLPPVDGAKRYLVVLGSGLSQKEANRLRERAVANGMPRDSYITKLSW